VVGGRLQWFASEWHQISNSNFVYTTVAQGYRIPFVQTLPTTTTPQPIITFFVDQTRQLDQAIQAFYIMSFNPQADLSNGGYYHLYQVDDLKVPCFRICYSSLYEMLEFLKAFKSVIVSSLPANLINTPLLEHNYADLFQPMLKFTKA
jgi:hypothetical protein